MNVLLVSPKPEISERSVYVPLGILSIATYLTEKGHTVKFIDRSVKKYDYGRIISEFLPDIVGLSLISTKAIPDALKFCQIFKDRSIPVVFGGSFPSLMTELTLKSGVVDYVVIGEGEITMLELLTSIERKLPLSDIDGLAYIENGEIKINKHREFAKLAEFPIIDWSLVNPTKYFRSFFACNKMLYLYGSKGCPSQCTFCANKEYHRCTYRERPIEYLMKEIEYLVCNCGMDAVYFTDDYCCITKVKMHDFCDNIKATGLDFVWGCQTKINGFSEEDFKYMYDAGCRWLFFGIESGSKERLAKIKKGIDYDRIVETATNCYNAGIVTITGFIIGFPDETEEELYRTVELAQKMPFAMYSFTTFCPLPGSELYYMLNDQGRFKLPPTLKELAKISPFDCFNHNFSNVSTREIKVIKSYFMLSAFLRKQPSKETKSFALAKKIANEQMRDIAKDGGFMMIRNLFKSLKTFMAVIYNCFFFPNICKKYGLYSKGTKPYEDNLSKTA